MAGQDDDTERSEDPTQKRLDEALERGDVVKSQEVNYCLERPVRSRTVREAQRFRHSVSSIVPSRPAQSGAALYTPRILSRWPQSRRSPPRSRSRNWPRAECTASRKTCI